MAAQQPLVTTASRCRRARLRSLIGSSVRSRVVRRLTPAIIRSDGFVFIFKDQTESFQECIFLYLLLDSHVFHENTCVSVGAGISMLGVSGSRDTCRSQTRRRGAQLRAAARISRSGRGPTSAPRGGVLAATPRRRAARPRPRVGRPGLDPHLATPLRHSSGVRGAVRSGGRRVWAPTRCPPGRLARRPSSYARPAPLLLRAP